MHLPDGFLNTGILSGTWFLSIIGIGYCLKKTARTLKDKIVPLMGVISAFIFAAQMVNFPVIGATSGHILGGVLAAVTLGPYAAAISLTCVLVVQCLIFQDGGLTALGANILNLSLAGAGASYYIYNILRKIIGGRYGIILGAGFAGWISIMLAAALCSIELAVSGVSEFKAILPAMLGIHAIIGAAEATVTGLIISFILKVRPDLLYNPNQI